MKKITIDFGFSTIKYFLFICALFGAYAVNSQNEGVAITTDGSDPDASAMLDVKSTSKGVLVPRLSFFEILSIISPADGLLVYNTDSKNFSFYDAASSQWKEILKTGQGSKWLGTGNIYYTGGNVGIGTSTTPLSELTIHGGSGTTNDAALTLDVDGTDWHVGIDDSDGDKLKIGTGSAVGTDTWMSVETDGDVVIGVATPTPGTNLQVNGTMEIFGAWASYAEGEIHHAETDGFVVAGLEVLSPTGITHIVATGFTDSNPSPTTKRGYACIRYTDYGVNVMSSFTMPVRKGDYWKVEAIVHDSHFFHSFIYWVPLGFNE
ncbi:MAG: hypothetical protein K8S16_03730 [Bacteroidales bacterium]|nr:hypothetical protein [Bacteroidales bacterium]